VLNKAPSPLSARTSDSVIVTGSPAGRRTGPNRQFADNTEVGPIRRR
jgi:hypothetical protein